MTNIIFQWGGAEVALGMDESGDGCSVVLLPALSSISTRNEMLPLFDRLSSEFHVATVDWPGFGDLPRPRADWSPEILSRFLDWFLDELIATPCRIVAAGHAAAYALHAAARRPGLIERLALIAPTWRGPLPTMMGGQRPWFSRVRAAIDNPVVGPLLYRLNVSRPVLDSMARRHVYSRAGWLAGERLAAKLEVTGAPGARHGSVRFVSGALDRIESRDSFLDLARGAHAPILVVYGAETPPRSRAEIEALAALPNVRLERLPIGKLAIHEELPDEVAAAIAPFLRGND
ncbi:MAG TPA: alpha/beta hydrolase [Roseiarcus sp.]|jgi:pimeloyl-ACP methyl ester carboxylesterase